MLIRCGLLENFFDFRAEWLLLGFLQHWLLLGNLLNVFTWLLNDCLFLLSLLRCLFFEWVLNSFHFGEIRRRLVEPYFLELSFELLLFCLISNVIPFKLLVVFIEICSGYFLLICTPIFYDFVANVFWAFIFQFWEGVCYQRKSIVIELTTLPRFVFCDSCKCIFN